MNLRLPPVSLIPASSASRPFPASASNSVTSCGILPSSRAFAITAFASGCSLLASSAIAMSSSFSSSKPSAAIISVTFGIPSVMVPVLSSATAAILPAFSSTSAVLNRIPFPAPMPFPTIMATGVARPSAQGHDMTRTDMLLASAYAVVCPSRSHTAKVTAAIEITTGTNTPETLSAAFAIGAFVAAASLTIFIICESVVSSPVPVALQRINPD